MVQVVVRNTLTYPDIRHVHSNPVRRNAFVVLRLEHIACIALVGEAFAECLNFRFEFLGNQDLMRQRGEGEIEVVGKKSILQLFRLAESIPNPVEVRDKSSLKVGKGRCSDVVSDDEQE